jgi:hypothetical protein
MSRRFGIKKTAGHGLPKRRVFLERLTQRLIELLFLLIFLPEKLILGISLILKYSERSGFFLVNEAT